MTISLGGCFLTPNLFLLNLQTRRREREPAWHSAHVRLLQNNSS